jgi:hypothetical protein
MCSPEAQAASAVVQGIMQQNAAVAAANRQNAIWRQNEANARVARTDEQRALNLRIGQEGNASAQQKMAILIDSLKTQGRAATASGEAGVSGTSVGRLMADITRQQTVAQGTVQRNFDMTKAQLNQQKEATTATYMGRVNSVQKGWAPSAGDAMLGIALNAGTAYGAGKIAQANADALSNWSLTPRGNLPSAATPPSGYGSGYNGLGLKPRGSMGFKLY